MSQLTDAIAMAKTASSRALGYNTGANPFEQYLKYAAEQATNGDTTLEDIGMAKKAAVELYEDSYNQYAEAVEKLAFAEQLYIEATQVEKTAADNGPGEPVRGWVDQVTTPAGAGLMAGGMAAGAVAGALAGNAVSPGMGGMAAGGAGGAILGAGIVAGAGALNAFLEQKRMARAQGLLNASAGMPQMPMSVPQ